MKISAGVMKGIVVLIGALFVLAPLTAFAANKVVVIPLSDGSSGDATKPDVLEGKTFSSASGIGLTGTRPPAPVGTDYTDTQHTIQPPNPRFYNSDGALGAGYGVKDLMTGLIWQKDLNPNLRTRSEADAYCNELWTTYPIPGIGFATAADWRLPTITELQSLIAHNVWDPALPIGVRSGVFVNLNTWGDYWSRTIFSSLCPNFDRGAILKYINMGYGDTLKILTCPGADPPAKYVWCVRGPYFLPVATDATNQ